MSEYDGESSTDSRSQSAPRSRSVSDWVQCLKEGDQVAAQRLWDRYFKKLTIHAARRAQRYNCPQGTIVPEDIAASVFESIWRGANAGRFDHVTNRDELWWLLQAMTCRKVVDHIRRETAQRRYPGHQPLTLSHAEPGEMFRELVSMEPTAEYLVIMQERYSALLGVLRDDLLRRIAVLKIEGFTNEEIQRELQISSATMTRKLNLIRNTWRQALADQDAEDEGQ